MSAYCIMDTGNMGMVIVGDHMLAPREHEFIIPGPEAHPVPEQEWNEPAGATGD
jgi:hypothetical protein